MQNIEDKIIRDCLGDEFTACVINRIMLSMTDNLIASAVLSQIAYFARILRPIRERDKFKHVSYYKKTEGWAFYKENNEFMEDLKLSRREFEGAIKLLKSKSYIQTKRFILPNSNSVVHYRLTPQFFSSLLTYSETTIKNSKRKRDLSDSNHDMPF